MISKTEHQKISVQTPDENIKTEYIASVLRSLVETCTRLQRARQKDNFFMCTLFFSRFEIIKMTRWYASLGLVYEMRCEAQFREIENSKRN